MLTTETVRACEVWGSPIGHSRSPQLHRAAYAALGLAWTYERREVDEAAFTSALAGAAGHLRGLSLTMPLKQRAYQAAQLRDEPAERTGAVNTLLLGATIAGFNTDVGGLAAALREWGVADAHSVRVLGAGATATSALAAAAQLGIAHVTVSARRPEAATDLVDRARTWGVTAQVESLNAPDNHVDLTISTLPAGSALSERTLDALRDHGGALYDVAYGDTPGPVAASWVAGGAPATSGLTMLLHQAVLQVRIFVSGTPETPLPDEPAVVAAMRAAVMGD